MDAVLDEWTREATEEWLPQLCVRESKETVVYRNHKHNHKPVEDLDEECRGAPCILSFFYTPLFCSFGKIIFFGGGGG